MVLKRTIFSHQEEKLVATPSPWVPRQLGHSGMQGHPGPECTLTSVVRDVSF
jgi:hypothetical protein